MLVSPRLRDKIWAWPGDEARFLGCLVLTTEDKKSAHRMGLTYGSVQQRSEGLNLCLQFCQSVVDNLVVQDGSPKGLPLATVFCCVSNQTFQWGECCVCVCVCMRACACVRACVCPWCTSSRKRSKLCDHHCCGELCMIVMYAIIHYCCTCT